MDEQGIISICDTFHLDYGRVRYPASSGGSRNMSISCPLAIKNHSDTNDANKGCSVEVVDDGPSRVLCYSGNCNFKGTLASLIRTAVDMRGNPPDLMKVVHEVEKLEKLTGQSRNFRAKKKIDDLLNPTIGIDPRARDLLPDSVFEPYAGSIPQYAIERGISVETAKAWGLGYDKEGGYLVFPVRRRDKRLVGLVGRAVSDKAKRKHHNYMGLDKSKHLFGAHMLQPGKPLVIVESCIDAINTWQALREFEVGTVATLGQGFSDEHVKLITTMRPPFVYIFTDGDRAGRLMANKIAYGLKGSVLIKNMECPWGPIIETTASGKLKRVAVDPSILPEHKIRQIYRDAKKVKRKIAWTNPPPIYDPREAA